MIKAIFRSQGQVGKKAKEKKQMSQKKPPTKMATEKKRTEIGGKYMANILSVRKGIARHYFFWGTLKNPNFDPNFSVKLGHFTLKYPKNP